MPNRINRPPYLMPTEQAKQTQQKRAPKTDRQFQAFVDEALQAKTLSKKEKTAESIHVSHHAQKRMHQRGIQLDQTDLTNLEEAFSTLEDKGAKNSLIIYEDLSLIASIQNRTIITASKTEEMSEVTNIDSAIHLKKE